MAASSPPVPPCNILVMASGNGSNFQALIDAVGLGKRIPDARISQLVVNRKQAFAVQRAERAGIPWIYFNLISNGYQQKGEKDSTKLKEARRKFDEGLAELVLRLETRPDLIVLAGWMQVFSSAFLDPIKKEDIAIINLHPALPGAYDGADAIERAFADFQEGKLKDARTGIMIHHVIDEVDRGEPILIREIECREGENLDQLKERIHVHEHQLIVEATEKVISEIKTRKEVLSTDGR